LVLLQQHQTVDHEAAPNTSVAAGFVAASGSVVTEYGQVSVS
jgi:hypothetical protein